MVLWSGMLAIKARSGDSAEDFRKNQIQNMHFFTFCGFPSKSDHRIWIFSINRFQGVYIMKFENTFYGFLILLKHVLALCSKFSVMVLATHTLKSPTSLGKDRYDWPWLAHNDWTRIPALTKTLNDINIYRWWYARTTLLSYTLQLVKDVFVFLCSIKWVMEPIFFRTCWVPVGSCRQ